MWPLQPEPAPKPEGAPRANPLCVRNPPRPHVHRPVPKNRSSGRATPRRRRRPCPLLHPRPRPRDRKPLPVDPLAGLAEELSRIPPPPAPGGLEPRPAPRRAPRPSLPASPAAPTADAPPLRPAIKIFPRWRNGWRLRCGVRPSRLTSRAGKPATTPSPRSRPQPASPALEDFAPPPASRLGAALRRPFNTDDVRASPFAPKTAGEAAGADMDEFAPAPSGPRFDTCPAAVRSRATRAAPTPPAPAANEEAAPPLRTPRVRPEAPMSPTASRRRPNRSTTVLSRRWRAC